MEEGKWKMEEAIKSRTGVSPVKRRTTGVKVLKMELKKECQSE